MSINKEAVKTLSNAVDILDEYGVTYEIKEVGFYGVVISADMARHSWVKVTIKLPRDVNKREVRKLIEPHLNHITPADYLR